MIVKTKPSQAIIEYLNLNKIINLNILGIIENEPDAEIYVDNEKVSMGVLVRYGYFNYIYTDDDAFLDEVLKTLFKDNFYGFSGVYRPLAEKIRNRYLVTWESRCSFYYLPKKNLDLSLIKSPIKSIDIRDAEIINELYTFKNSESLMKIKKDILNRPSSAIYSNGDIASWVLIHNDNSMGIMFTKEEYRKKNYAVDTSIDLAAKIIARGNIPFLQITESNNMSPGLASKCGFIKYGYSDWFGIIEGTPKEIIDLNNQNRNNHIKNIGEFKYLEGKELNCMYSPTNIDSTYEKIEGFTIEKVINNEMAEVWCQTLINVLEIKGSIKSLLKDMVYMAVSNNENGYILYNGILNDEIVSTTAFYKSGNHILGLYFTAVYPKMRKRGIGRATVIESITDVTKKDDIELILLQSPDKYVDMFKKLGFIHSHNIMNSDLGN
ncbi:MAG TPA: GNAT family N-acetyltransferase [Clostridium sp.]|uniref:GNAT family N-acetyltransferase n=1 Tax=Clostridium sp. TaxID=1506 RepID=UPI002F9383A4